MKKRSAVLCFLLLICMVFSSVSWAEEHYDTLVNWNVRIAVPEGATAVLEGNEYYIYAGQAGSIPYVMVRIYRVDDAEAFLKDFTAYMRTQYADLKVTADAGRKTIGDKDCFEIDYSYSVSGYEVRDRRIVTVIDGTVYMFASKEVEALGMTIGSMLEDVVADCEFLSDADAGQKSGLADGYLYRLSNGMPKYWLDFTGAVADNLVLHCYFRSSDPTFYERVYILDLSSAVTTENGLKILKVRDQYGFDHSNRFKDLSLRFYLDGAVMTVERDEKTLAGGPEDNILTGTYLMRPVGVRADGSKKQSVLCPMEDGPYQPEELGMWAQFYYFRNTGFFPPEAEVIKNADGTFTVHLYEVLTTDGVEHTATSAWYTVDAYGKGQNDITGEKISLIQ